jgi:Protein of unknown function (DUF3017)
MRVRWEVPPTRRLAFIAVLLVTGLGVVASAFWDFRRGGYLFALALALAAVLRASLPDRYCLGLLVRSRQLDVALAAALALALAVTVSVVPS